MKPFCSYSQTEGSPLCRFTHCNACVHWECVWEGLALCWLCPDIHSHTISAARKGCITQPLHIDQSGVCHAAVGLFERLPTWKYQIPVLSGGPVCNCVLSDLQSPSHSFVPDIFHQWIYFSFFGILAVVPLVTKFSFFLPPCVLWANDKSVWKLHFVWKEKKKKSYPIKKRSPQATDEWANTPMLYQFMVYCFRHASL